MDNMIPFEHIFLAELYVCRNIAVYTTYRPNYFWNWRDLNSVTSEAPCLNNISFLTVSNVKTYNTIDCIDF